MNSELHFFLIVSRNAFILAGLYFFSVWATGALSWLMCKPIIIFLGTYILTELVKRYQLTTREQRIKCMTLIL